MHSPYKLNKQGDNIQPWHTPFSIWKNIRMHISYVWILKESTHQCTLIVTMLSYLRYVLLKESKRSGIFPPSYVLRKYLIQRIVFPRIREIHVYLWQGKTQTTQILCRLGDYWIVFIHQLPKNTCKFSLIKVGLSLFSSLQDPQHWIISVWVSSGIWRNSSLRVLLTIGWPQGNNFPTQLSDHAPASPTPQCLVLFSFVYDSLRASLLAQTVKNRLAMWEARVWSLGPEDPLEKGIATHPWRKE